MMKNILIILLTFGLGLAMNVSAQMDNSFTYQGELLDNGSPANDTYDFQVVMLDGNAGQVGVTSQHNGVQVTNGLFSLNVSFGIAMFDGYENYYFEVSVRKTSVGGAYTTLSPLQQLQSVPLASNLVNGNATAGQVLTFNGFQWGPATNPSSPWSVNGSEIYTNENVGIGTNNPVPRLHVSTTSGFETARFNGGSNMYVIFSENDVFRGYIGSYQTPSGSITDADFEVGTTSGSSGNLLLVTGDNTPRVTVDADGLVGVGTTNPDAKLQVDGNSATDPYLFRVRDVGSTKLVVDNNGGTAIGSFVTPPSNGLSVAGDVKQPSSSNGMMKYMVEARCNGASSSITKFYNGVSTGSVTSVSTTGTGICRIRFPESLSSRYFQVSPVSAYTVSANCHNSTGGNVDLFCFVFNTNTGVGVDENIMILVY
ncbi:MAG: hypothetical protein KDI59_03660 [Xanthomonadales bacterium]|nr:hypothetical protein [Xanthomonadales bacterium]